MAGWPLNMLQAAMRGEVGANDYLGAETSINTIITLYSVLFANTHEAFRQVGQLGPGVLCCWKQRPALPTRCTALPWPASAPPEPKTSRM